MPWVESDLAGVLEEVPAVWVNCTKADPSRRSRRTVDLSVTSVFAMGFFFVIS